MTTLTDTKPDTRAGMYALAVTEMFSPNVELDNAYDRTMAKLYRRCLDRGVGIRAYHKNQGGAEKVTFTITPGDPFVVVAEARVVQIGDEK